MKEAHNLLVRFDCGCVGFRPNENNQSLLVKFCDADNSEMSFAERSMTVGFKPLDTDAENAILCTIADQVAKGYKFDSIRNILGK